MYMAHERRAHILRLLAERGSIRSAALAEELGVTDETIRTDLVLLESQGQLRRRHGGAEFLPPPAGGQTNATRVDYQLARELLEHIPPHTRLAIDASRFTPTLLSLLRERPLTLITHSPALMQDFAAAALPHSLMGICGEVDKSCCRLCPAAGALAQAAPTLAVLSPERVALQGRELAISYRHRADQLWAQELMALGCPLLLAFPASALASGAADAAPSLRCRPQVVVTEDNLPANTQLPGLRLIPYLDPADLLPGDSFDY